MSKLGDVYQGLYDAICGLHPNYKPWHFQWMFLRGVHRWQRKHMLSLSGRVLDVGCGDKPYGDWINASQVNDYVGLDVFDGDRVDVVVEPGKKWPLKDASFDAILFTQVLEHLEDRDFVLSEMSRVLKKDGVVLVTVPFLFPVHGLPFDFARFTTNGVKYLFNKDYEIREATTHGKVGTVLASIFLTWIDGSLNTNMVTRLLKGVLLPIWLVVSLATNLMGLILDALDRTESHYGNVCLIAVKR